MKLTVRDKEILSFINQFGFCNMTHLNMEFGFNKTSCRNYRVIRRLIEHGYLNYKQFGYKEHGIYWLTKKGAFCTDSDLPPIKEPLETNVHSLMVLNVYFALQKRYKDSLWISERVLERKEMPDGLGKNGHIPDGILYFSENKKIPIEVELTQKNSKRLSSIIKEYGQSNFSEIWYFGCHNVVKKIRQQPLLILYSQIKIHTLQEIGLAEPRRYWWVPCPESA